MPETSEFSRRFLESLARTGQLTDAGLDMALRRLNIIPDAARWRHFADRLLLAAGSLLLLAGIVFFFAFNWNDLHRFVKMALVALPLLLSASRSATLPSVRSNDSLESKAWLSAAVVLTGVLLAVIGQIYQTGADSELLFAGWALLVLPWVIVARAAWLWLFWLVLTNVALTLFVMGRLDVWAFLFVSDSLFWWPVLFNVLALGLWEFFWPRIGWMRETYAPRFIAILAAIAASSIGVSWWFLTDRVEWPLMRFTPLIYLPWLLGTSWFYRTRRLDIVPLAVAALSAIVVITSGLIKALFDYRDFDVSSFLLLGIAVAVMTAGAAVWLRQTASHWEYEKMAEKGANDDA